MTTQNFFAGCQTVNDIKAKFRTLAFKYHPDVSTEENATEIMKEINNQYQSALKGRHGTTSKGTDNKDHTYYYNEAVEQAIMDKIAELIALKLSDINIWLVGTWIWVDGETKKNREALKELKLRWHSKRQKWYFRSGGSYKRRYNPNASFDDLKHTYGAKHFESAKENSVATA